MDLSSIGFVGMILHITCLARPLPLQAKVFFAFISLCLLWDNR
ncbi:hypothetical protein BPJM79_20301 [Bacillus pumilus]